MVLASEKQKNLLRNLEIPFNPNTLTIQSASSLIGAELAKRGKMTDKQKALLLKLGEPFSYEMSKKEAAALITKALAHRPKTFYRYVGRAEDNDTYSESFGSDYDTDYNEWGNHIGSCPNDIF